MLSKLTLIGLHNYTNGKLWENMELPEGIDKDILVNEILRQNGEFCVIYPDPEFLKIQITYWSKKWYHNFERWITVSNKQYEALFNVDVKEVIEEHGINADNGSKSASDSRNIAGSSSHNSSGTSSGTNGSLDTKSKAAYDASTFQAYEQDSLSTSTSLSSSEGGSESNNSSESGSHSESETHSGSYDITTTNIKQGNQGITMSQEMLLAEYNAWRFNLYAQIADIFASEFCITLYA